MGYADEGLEPTKIIKLNVGGVRYATSVATLTAAEHSYFQALFSGRWQQNLTEDGEVFLDRDGEVRSRPSESYLAPYAQYSSAVRAHDNPRSARANRFACLERTARD